MMSKQDEKLLNITLLTERVVEGQTEKESYQDRMLARGCKQEEKYMIFYETNLNQKSAKVEYHFSGESLTIKQLGEINSTMIFQKDTMNPVVYETPQGSLIFLIRTLIYDVEWSKEDFPQAILAEYELLDEHTKKIAHCKLCLTISMQT